MPSYDLIIRNGTVVTSDGIHTSDVALADGQIAEIAPEIAGTATEIDARGLSIFPGVIDAHVHFNEPGRTNWEGIVTGSRAFAAGGGTTYFDMPLNAHPPTINRRGFELKLAAARAGSLTDFALWGGIVPGNLDDLDELAACGVIGFKAFMSATGTADFPAADDLTLYEGMARAARLDLPVAVHAENDHMIGALARRAVAAGRVSARDYLASRPVVAELEAIGRAICFAEVTGCALHIVHVSTGRGVARVVEARARGVDVTCETCTHYLALTEDDVERLGAVAKCAPPLRTWAEQDALWRCLIAGDVPMVTSDHSPAPPALRTSDNFFALWGGISGCQSTLPVLLTAGYEARELPLTTIGALLAGNVAQRFRLSRKGRLTVGADADLALVDLNHTDVLTADDLHYRHRQSPYIGRRFRGRVVHTLVRGQTVMWDGRVAGEPAGELVRPCAGPDPY